MRDSMRGAMALVALIAWTGGFGMAEANPGDETKDGPAADASTADAAPESKLPEWRSMWNFGDPAGTEAKEWFGKAWDLLKDDKWMQADDADRLARMKELGGR